MIYVNEKGGIDTIITQDYSVYIYNMQMLMKTSNDMNNTLSDQSGINTKGMTGTELEQLVENQKNQGENMNVHMANNASCTDGCNHHLKEDVGAMPELVDEPIVTVDKMD